jgi:2-polyprenyl-3-methyl-5-hydroxy-6-metoxy-1,4-benzoquinol methylase
MPHQLMNSDDNSVVQGQSQDSVDQANARFYGRFPFPWRPMKFDRLVDPQFQTIMLNQNLGDWSHQTLSGRLKIWVAGCGTNQALITALNFPEAQVIGSDLSKESLELGTSTARELGLKNLELRCESINQVPYADEFDYVICTGVIHHNANPEITLAKLAQALKPGGVMELMVYNRYERLPTTAFQKAIRLLGGESNPVDYEADLTRAKRIASEVRLTNFGNVTEANVDELPDCLLADLLIQPVENSYTVESLEDLAGRCNLALLYPCYDMFDKGTISWSMSFTDPELQSSYDGLSDAKRWQVTNHLLFERSPQLWFTFQRKDSPHRRKDEKEICDSFLKTRFKLAATTQRSFIRQSDELYKPSDRQLPYPLAPPPRSLQQVVQLVDGKRTMGEIFSEAGMKDSFQNVNHARLRLTTTAFPYLRAVSEVEVKNREDTDEQTRLKIEESKLNKFRTIQPRAVTVAQKSE